jgi:hypothetical protein
MTGTTTAWFPHSPSRNHAKPCKLFGPLSLSVLKSSSQKIFQGRQHLVFLVALCASLFAGLSANLSASFSALFF